jgi:small subunit ribosomal protein S17
MTKPTVQTTEVKRVRSFIGVVVKAAMAKTLVVQVDRKKEITKYQKSYTVSRKYHVHDEKGVGRVGQVVKFAECRPLSKTKRWRLLEVVKTI